MSQQQKVPVRLADATFRQIGAVEEGHTLYYLVMPAPEFKAQLDRIEQKLNKLLAGGPDE
jgi:hypothetical protein